MSKKSFSNTEFLFRESNPHHYLKFLDFLQKEGSEEDYVETVLNFMSSVQTAELFDIENTSLIGKIVQHSLKAAAKLFLLKQESSALELLESARNLISQISNKDKTLDRLKTLLYNNIGAYCISIEDSAMAIKFLQNCLKKDIGISSSLTCIFFNNLAGIYLTNVQYEKAFNYTKKSLYLLEPEIFTEIKAKSVKFLRENIGFRKNLTVLLVGYLNMGSILEGYQFKTTLAEPSKEMLEMSPKSFYKNSYGLAKKFLGESHPLTLRLHFCYHKSEFLLFKEINSTENSDIEKHKTPKKRLKYMLDEIDDEDNTTTKAPKSFRLRGHSPKSNSSKTIVAKNLHVKRTSLSTSSKVKLHHRQSIETSLNSQNNSNNNSFEDNIESESKSTHKFTGNDYKKYMSKVVSPPENNFTPYMHRRKSAGTTYKPHNSQHSYTGQTDQTQILLQVMFHQQRDLEEKLNKKFEELKGVSRLNTMDTSDMKFIEPKEDPKIKILEKEIEMLKEKMFKMNVEKDIEERPKTTKAGNAPVINLPSEISSFQGGSRLSESKKQNSLKTISTVDTTTNPQAKETESSTKSNGLDVNYYLSPHRVLQPHSGRPDKNSFDHNNTGLPLDEPLSPISKDEKLYFGDSQQGHPKEPNWVPGKYSDPKNRKFQLDLNKVGTNQRGEEEIRHRQPEPETKPENNQAPVKKETTSSEFANFNKLNNFMQHEPTKGVPKLKDIKQSEKIPLKKFQSDKSQNSVESVNTTAKEDQLKTFVNAVNDAKKKAMPTMIAPQDTSNMSIKLAEPEKNTTRTQKEDQSDQGNDKTDKKVTDDDDSEEAKSIIAYKRNSISIPTSIDFMDSIPGQFNPLGQVKVPKFAVIKKRVFMDDNTQFIIACNATWTKEEKIFKLQLMGVDESTGTELTKIESELELPYTDLKAILKHIEHKDVMPITLHIKQIKNFYTIVRFLLMPFTTVRIQEDGKKEIAIYPKPPNLLTNSLNDMPTIDFMGQQCVIIFTHIIHNIFRIVLTHPENVEEVLRIDVDFDQTSLEHCFKKSSGKDAVLRTVDSSVKIIQGFDDDADDEEFNECKEISKKMTNPERVDEEELETYKVINKNMVEDIANILKEMEEFFVSLGIKKMAQLADEKEVKYCKLKIAAKMKKPTLHFVWDKSDKQILEVRLKNFFETFGKIYLLVFSNLKAPNQKVKALGKVNYLYESVWKHFGLNYSQLEPIDRITVLSYISDVYDLSVFEKELSKEEFERYEENPISFVPIEIGAHHRVFLGEKYKFPLTLSMIGIRGVPKGIKATIYNFDEAIEIGAFFHINASLWLMHESGKKKKKTYKVLPMPLIENYHLDHILRRCGWEILKSWLVLDKRPNRVDIVGIKIFKEIRSMEQLENVLNSDTILKYYNEKDEVEA